MDAQSDRQPSSFSLWGMFATQLGGDRFPWDDALGRQPGVFSFLVCRGIIGAPNRDSTTARAVLTRTLCDDVPACGGVGKHLSVRTAPHIASTNGDTSRVRFNQPLLSAARISQAQAVMMNLKETG
jgi:hypothetical protein